MLFYSLLFLFSGFLLLWASNWLVASVSHIARYLGWKEFVIAFFVMAVAAAFPNLFVGIIAAFNDIPELSFGDVVGNSVVDFTLVAALAVLFGNRLKAEEPLIQRSLFFTIGVAVLPILLILDKELGRGDALVLLIVFLLYSIFLLSQRSEYTQTFERAASLPRRPPLQRFRIFLQHVLKTGAAILLLLASAEGVVSSIQYFVEVFHIPVVTVGILVLGFGSALPEIYFTIAAAKKGNNSIILGELMGTIIVMSTLVLAIVTFIQPIFIDDFSPYLLARVFLVLSALFFLLFLRTDHAITRREAIVLLGLYVAFVAGEIIIRTTSLSL